MSPAYGRPPSDNPKVFPFQMRLSENDKAVLEACRKTYGLSKSETFLFGLEILEFATKNSDFRQLMDAFVILKQIEDRKDKYEAKEFQELISRQLRQIKFNFEEFMKTYQR